MTGPAIANGNVVRSLNGLTDVLTLAAGPNIALGTVGNTITISNTASSGLAWLLNGNGGTAATNFLGTTDNQPLEIRVNNARALRLEPNITSPNLIGGYLGNAAALAVGITIAGGGQSGSPNIAYGGFSTISGGQNNTIQLGGANSTVGGGQQNTVQSFATAATISGGSANQVSATGSTVGGGQNNSADGIASVIGGGTFNLNSGQYSTIGGGIRNTNATQLGTIGGGSLNFLNSPVSGTIGGGYQNTVLGADATIAGGSYNTVQVADYSALAGGSINFIGTRVTDLIEFGFQTNNAYAAVIGGGVRNTNIGYFSTLGGGQYNTIIGPLNNVEASHAVVAGGLHNQNVAQNAGTIGGGRDNIVSSDYATVPGGRSASPNNYGEFTFAAGHMDFVGDAQASTLVLRRKFSGNGDLYLNGDTSDARVFIQGGSVWTIHFQISAISAAGANFGSYEVSGVVGKIGAATTFVMMDGSGAVVTGARPIYRTPGASGWIATPYINADGSLRVAVFAGETVKWTARLDVAEVRR